MLSDRDRSSTWVTVQCPVCGDDLGIKKRDEIKTFTCTAEGCSQTEHTFYPGQIKRPGSSRPWASYHDEKSICNCASCQSRRLNG